MESNNDLLRNIHHSEIIKDVLNAQGLLIGVFPSTSSSSPKQEMGGQCNFRREKGKEGQGEKNS